MARETLSATLRARSVAARVPAWLQSAPDERRLSKQRPPGGAVSVSPTGIPGLLKHRHQWAVWRYTRDGRGATSKPPCQPDGRSADGHNPGTWSSFDECFEAYRNGDWDGVSYCFVDGQGTLAFDLDHYAKHQVRSDALVHTLDSYTETSPGGDGLHIWLLGQLPDGRRRRDDIEIYSRARFLSVTGQRVPGTPAEIRTSPMLHWLWQRWVHQDG